jgi:NO-binding membrane sensor protein with MHYT domain
MHYCGKKASQRNIILRHTPCAGMAAMCLDAKVHWNGGIIFASFLVAVAVASAAFYIIFRLLVWKNKNYVIVSAVPHRLVTTNQCHRR